MFSRPAEVVLFGVFWGQKQRENSLSADCPLISNTPCLFRCSLITARSVTMLQMFTSANHEEEVLCIQYIFTIPEEPLDRSQAFSAHLFRRGPINQLHSPPPVSLCHADQLDQSALQKKKRKKGARNEQLANKMAFFNADL